ncbi:hypothetical protein J4412_02440 [Candidatus Pacearchaeota archaeon]|nr:hypothetical protein [Candidatus Pacearchaeota archaeon]
MFLVDSVVRSIIWDVKRTLPHLNGQLFFEELMNLNIFENLQFDDYLHRVNQEWTEDEKLFKFSLEKIFLNRNAFNYYNDFLKNLKEITLERGYVDKWVLNLRRDKTLLKLMENSKMPVTLLGHLEEKNFKIREIKIFPTLHIYNQREDQNLGINSSYIWDWEEKNSLKQKF